MPEKMVNGNQRKNLIHRKMQIVGLKHIKCTNIHHIYVKSVEAGMLELKKYKNRNEKLKR